MRATANITAKVTQVLHVAHREREARRDAEEVERGDADEGGQHRGAAAEAHGDEHHRQQKKHDDIGEVEVGQQRHRHECGGSAGRERPHVA